MNQLPKQFMNFPQKKLPPFVINYTINTIYESILFYSFFMYKEKYSQLEF